MNPLFFSSILSILLCVSSSSLAMEDQTENNDTQSIESFPISNVSTSDSELSYSDILDIEYLLSKSKKRKVTTLAQTSHPKSPKVKRVETEEEKKIRKREYSRNYYATNKEQYRKYYTPKNNRNLKINKESKSLYELVKQTPEYAALCQHRASHKAECKEKLLYIYENDQQATSINKEYHKNYYQREKLFIAALHDTPEYKVYWASKKN